MRAVGYPAAVPRNPAIERVLSDEEAGGLWFRDLLGYPVWSLERLRRYRLEVLRDDQASAGATSQSKGRARVEAEWTAIRASLADLRRGGPVERTRRGRDVWVLGNTTYRRKLADGQWRCIFADHLRRQLGDRLLFLEFNAARLPSLEREDVCFLDAVQIPLLTAARVTAPAVAAAWSVLRRQDLRAFSGTSSRRLADRAIYGRGLLEVARRWIDAAPPEAIFVLCGYTMHGPIQLAARERGIPIIELQHGIVHESHAGYVLPVLPASRTRSLPLPDHLVVFGQYFGQVLERESPRWAGRWTVGGHPWLRAKRAEAAVASVAGKLLVLFSQYELDVRIQIRDAAEAARIALGPEWRVVLKPHPREADAAEFFASAVAAGVELAGASDDSYGLMARADLAVTSYSTICIEALAFPCRSVVLPSDRWTEAITDLIEAGLIERAADGTELAALAQQTGGGGDREAVARDLFGIGLEEPDFAAMIQGALRR